MADASATPKRVMVELSDLNGKRLYFMRGAIARWSDAGASQAWHGVGANVQTFDGQWVEVRERPDEIARQVGECGG